MHIAILGSGAVGGYFGAKLARAGEQVTFIARGAHLRAIRERGLLVWSPLGDFVARGRAENDPSRVGPADLVLVAVKTYDNETALPLLGPLVGPHTVVLTLQNGVESAERVAGIVGTGRVLGGTTYVATALKLPGLIEQTGTHRRIAFGESFSPAAQVSQRVERIAEVLAAADIQVESFPDARVPIWEKFIYLSAVAAFTAAARLPTGPIWADPFIRERFLEAVHEVERVARAEGVPVSQDVESKIVGYMEALPPTMRSSLLIDLSAGKRLEVEALQGAVVRLGRKHGVPTPTIDALYAVLKPHAGGAVG
jgi:2-dehydropantoate 2-reductase